MRTLPLLFLAAVAASTPAAAQIVGRPTYGPVGAVDPFLGNGRMPAPSTRDELRDIDRRIDRGRAGGTLMRRETRQLRREARAIGRLDRVYRRDGLSDSERHALQARTLYLRSLISRPAPAQPAAGRSGG